MTYIVQSKNADGRCDTVVAPKGYYRTRDGRVVRDGTPSPEMGPIHHAYRFKSHRSAARTASTLAHPIIREYEETTPDTMFASPRDMAGDGRQGCG
jgi:hypothetical protein